MKYKAELLNSLNCAFDSACFNSISTAKAWARKRGGKNKLVLKCGETTKEFFVK